MDTWYTFLIASLAVYRLSRMIAYEEGPFSMFTKFREKLGKGYDPAFPEHSTWLGRGVNCPMCISFWLGFVVATLLLLELKIILIILTSLALSAVTVILNNKVG